MSGALAGRGVVRVLHFLVSVVIFITGEYCLKSSPDESNRQDNNTVRLGFSRGLLVPGRGSRHRHLSCVRNDLVVLLLVRFCRSFLCTLQEADHRAFGFRTLHELPWDTRFFPG